MISLLVNILLLVTNLWLFPSNVAAFVPLCRPTPSSSVTELAMSKVGIFFGTSTGSTEAVAELLAEEFGDDAEGPFDIEALEGSVKDSFGMSREK